MLVFSCLCIKKLPLDRQETTQRLPFKVGGGTGQMVDWVGGIFFKSLCVFILLNFFFNSCNALLTEQLFNK